MDKVYFDNHSTLHHFGPLDSPTCSSSLNSLNEIMEPSITHSSVEHYLNNSDKANESHFPNSILVHDTQSSQMSHNLHIMFNPGPPSSQLQPQPSTNNTTQLFQLEKPKTEPLPNSNSLELTTNMGPGHSYVDVTPYLNLSQNEAAKRLNIPSSTLSKRWREATVGRKWPYRNIAKIEKEMQTLLKNAPDQDASKLPHHMQDTLARLSKRKGEEARPVFIRLY